MVVWFCDGLDVKGSSSVFFVGQLVKGRQTKGQSSVQSLVPSIVNCTEHCAVSRALYNVQSSEVLQ